MFLSRMIRFVAVFMVAALPGHAMETTAEAAWVYDITTDTVLLEKRADVPLPPASMSKLMTLNMLFEALDDGRVQMDTRFGVSARAAAMGGSTMFLDERDRPTVEELIQGIVVQSGNDACVVVAEGLAGSEEAFANMMNDRARALGMTQSNFVNSSGWPHPEHRMSMRDLGILATRLVTEFPDLYGYFAQQRFEYDGRAPDNSNNRNPLLGLGIGADGLKTGHTVEAGYGLVGSAVQGTRRIVFVVTGLASERARSEESERLVSWAFRQFVERALVGAGETIVDVPVWLGDRRNVALVAREDVSILVPAVLQEGIAAEARFTSPLEAPLAAGTEVGRLTISRGELPEHSVPLVTAEEIGRAGFRPRLETAARVLARDLLGDRAESLGLGAAQ